MVSLKRCCDSLNRFLISVSSRFKSFESSTYLRLNVTHEVISLKFSIKYWASPHSSFSVRQMSVFCQMCQKHRASDMQRDKLSVKIHFDVSIVKFRRKVVINPQINLKYKLEYCAILSNTYYSLETQWRRSVVTYWNVFIFIESIGNRNRWNSNPST